MKPEARACCVVERRPVPGWRRHFLLASALMLTLVLGACQKRQDDDVAIHIRSAQLLSVPGNGYTEPPLRADEQALAGSWRTVALPNIAERELVATPDARIRTVTDWYRIDLGALQPTTAARHLYLPRWKTIGQLAVYGDGRLLYSSHGSMAHNGYNHPLLLQLNAAADERPPAVVMLRIDRLQGGGSALSTVWAGSEKPLVWRYQVRQVLQTQLPFVLSAAFLTVGIFALAVWVRLRRDSLYLLFFVISAVAFIRTLHYHVGGSYLPINDEWFEWISIASLMWLMVLSHCFMERLHENPMRGLTPTLLVVTALVNVMTMPGFFTLMPQLTLFAPLLYMLMLPFALLIFLDALRNGFRMNSREVWLMAGWLVSATLCCFYDLALQSNWVSPEGLYTNPYAIIGMFVMFLYIMFRRYVGAMSEVEQANANLAQRLQSREAELVTSYERLREIERRQTLSNERLRLTQDMHDGLGSSLVTALRVVESGRMTDSELGAILKSCIDDLKLTIDSMEPVDADLLLLLATLRFRLGPRLTAAGISLKWEVRDLPRLEWLNPRSALHILRTLQEAFANILKHTRATEIRVRTSVEGDGVQVTIGDNGQGFNVEETLRSHAGSGLGNQQRRVQSIGGRVNWTSDATGTCLTLWLPLRPPFPAAAE